MSVILPLRSLVTVSRLEIGKVMCNALDNGVICHAPVVGHLWPSDVARLQNIKRVKDSRGQEFPFVRGKFVCLNHYELFEKAIEEISSGSRT